MQTGIHIDGRRPLVAIPACRRILDPHPFHVVGEKYINAVVSAADAVPVLVPALGPGLAIADLLGRVDGLMLTGSPSNVEPHHYAGRASRHGTAHDPHRDATTLPLIRAVVAAGLPVLAICRGFQEVNVALGGSLHQNVQDLPGMLDHREDESADLEHRYAPVHELELSPGGALQALAAGRQVRVNSLHAQGVDRLADALLVEATAPDGLIEAFRLRDDRQFLLGVQWHPEWRVLDDPFSRAIFHSFGAACRRFAHRAQHEHDHELV